MATTKDIHTTSTERKDKGWLGLIVGGTIEITVTSKDNSEKRASGNKMIAEGKETLKHIIESE